MVYVLYDSFDGVSRTGGTTIAFYPSNISFVTRNSDDGRGFALTQEKTDS